MLTPNPAALTFLQQRRSRPAKTLTGPVPDPEALRDILTVAARSPDHGKLEPWRMLVLRGPALARLAAAVPARGAALGLEPDKIEKMERQFRFTDLAVAVISAPKPSDKIPQIEQIYSAGAVCYGLLTAALAAGWGANWLSGWASHDRIFVETHLGLTPQEQIAGFIHLGTESVAPQDRPRPDLDQIVTWVEA